MPEPRSLHFELEVLTAAEPVALDALEIAATRIEVNTVEDFRRCAVLLTQVKDAITEHTAHWEPLRAASYALYEAVLDKINAKLGPANKSAAVLSTKLSDFRLAQDRKSKELAEEHTRTHQKTLQEAQEASRDLILSGKPAEGLAMLQRARLTTSAPAPVNLKLPGTAQVEDYKITISDFKAFCQAVVDGEVPDSILELRSGQPVLGVRISALRSLRASMGEAFEMKGVTVNKKYSYRRTRA